MRVDKAINKDYSHRKQWIKERLAQLSNTFAIDICAYSLMDNLNQLGIDSDTLLETVNAFKTEFHAFVGPEHKLQSICRKLFFNKKLCLT